MKSIIFLENTDSLVKGPGIELLKKTFEDMFQRGAPVVDDFTGFNKIDFNSFRTIVSDAKYNQDSIPVAMASRILIILNRYKNTQIHNYDQIKDLVEKDIKNILKIEDSEEIVIHTDAARQYGKIKVYVPGGLDKKIVTKIGNLIVEKKKLSKVRDNFGAMKYPIFRYFNTEKNHLHTYYIHPEVLEEVVKLISSETGLKSKVSGQPIVQTVQTPVASKGNSDLIVVGIEETRYGKKIAINLNIDYDKSKAILDSMKSVGLVPSAYSYSPGRPPKFLISADSKDLYNSVKQKLIDNGINVSDLDKFIEENKIFAGDVQKAIAFETKAEIKTDKPLLKFQDPSNGTDNSISINIPYRNITSDQKAFLKELVQYSFPGYEWDGTNYAYIVSGNFKQYATFGQILKKFGYHVEDLRKILDKKLSSGGVLRTAYEGKIEKDFKEKIEDRLPNSKFELYDEQKDGISFLYGRNHAILGDATGVGKCITFDSLLLTDKGMVKIGDLAPKNIDLVPDKFYPIEQDIKVWTGKKWAKIKSFYYAGVKPAIKLSTELGYNITGSLIHPIITRGEEGLESFIKLSEIEKDDHIALVRDKNIEFPIDEPALPSVDTASFGPTAKIYKTPNKLDPNLSAFLGYIVSEGWTAGRNCINIFQDKKLNPETHEHIRLLAKNIFGWEGNVNNAQKDFEIRMSSVYIRSYLHLIGIDFSLSSQKSVPWPIFKGTRESIISFIRSFFDSEGSVHRGAIEVSIASEQMLKDIQTLLLRLGIVCSRRPKIIRGRKNIYWRITICGSNARKFQKNIGFITKRKQESLNYLLSKKKNTNIDLIPNSLKAIEQLRSEIFRACSVKGCNENRKNTGLKKFGKSFASTLSNIRNKNRNPTYDFLKIMIEISKSLDLQKTLAHKSVEKIYQNYYFYDSVECLEEKEEKLADIEVDDDEHCFVANGFINHNTTQLISAAELKMQDLGQNSKTLVITIKSVQKQWVEEIKNVIGENADISENGLQPKQWTVLYYDNFSSGGNLNKIIETIKKSGYSIVIFDELHKLKHTTSKRSQNIEDATKDIPYKWGASATISANRAMDVKNQLVMVGHPLGKISDSKFKRDFAGMVPGGYKGSYQDGSFEDRIRAAEKLNKWLNLSGVYVRRTKEDLRKMPNIDVGASSTSIDQDKFYRDLGEKLKGYKNPDLAISELIASREILAKLKVDHTVEKSFEIIKNNLSKPENNYAASKVVIFTNFAQPGKDIYEKLSSKLKELDPNFKVLTYLSLTKKTEREKVKEVFSNSPNAKALVMSMKMGGTGISFPNASQNMIINDFDWTPESAEQSEGRIYRINTTHPVNITYIITDGLDTELFSIVQKKRKLAELIQKYRKEYQEKEIDESTIQKIIDAQKKVKEIDEEISSLIARAAAKAMKESVSFKEYLDIAFKLNNR